MLLSKNWFGRLVADLIEDIPKIFSPFVRLQTPLTYKTSGTGLGLYMVKKNYKRFPGWRCGSKKRDWEGEYVQVACTG